MKTTMSIATLVALGLAGGALAQQADPAEGAGLGADAPLTAEAASAEDAGAAAWKENCQPSQWGAEDQTGALNRITPEKVREAAGLVKQGKAVRMGIEVQKETPSFPPRVWSVHTFLPSQEGGRSYGVNKFNYIDDVVMGWNGTGPQIDTLAHGGIDNMFYNCTPVEELLKADGVTKFGAETVPAIATRGVILDMAALTGQNPVPEGTVFNRAEIDAAMERQGLQIEEGDVVIFYTGWTDLIGEDDERYSAGEPGIGIEGARYLADLGVAMVGADTWGLDAVPFEDPEVTWRAHQILLAENGIFILENVTAKEAVEDGVYEGLFTLGPARMTGAVQAIINPIFVY